MSNKQKQEKMTTLAQYTDRERAENKLIMFERRVIEYRELLENSRKSKNIELVNIYLTELNQCEKMVCKLKEEYNKLTK